MAESKSLWNGSASRVAGSASDVDLLKGIVACANLDKITNHTSHDTLACELLSKPVTNVTNPIRSIQ